MTLHSKLSVVFYVCMVVYCVVSTIYFMCVWFCLLYLVIVVSCFNVKLVFLMLISMKMTLKKRGQLSWKEREWQCLLSFHWLWVMGSQKNCGTINQSFYKFKNKNKKPSYYIRFQLKCCSGAFFQCLATCCLLKGWSC